MTKDTAEQDNDPRSGELPEATTGPAEAGSDHSLRSAADPDTDNVSGSAASADPQSGTAGRSRSADKQADTVAKIRWSLRQRLEEHMRRLLADVFDELDDFLFGSVQPEELTETNTQLRLVREFRNKKPLFEDRFLGAIDAALQATLVDSGREQATSQQNPDPASGSSAFEAMEIDLALEQMQRRAFKTYAGQIQKLGGPATTKPAVADPVIPENRDILIRNSLRALAISHPVFRVSLESRLVFLKFFEAHFLMKLERLYQEVISIITHQDNRRFVEKLYSSSTSIHRRRKKAGLQSSGEEREAEEGIGLSGAERVSVRVEAMLSGWCAGQKLPEFAESMLRDDWQAVMTLAGRNRGLDSREWHEASTTIEILLQQLASIDRGESVAAAETVELKDRLQQGFKLAQVEQGKQDLFLGRLKDYHETAAAAKVHEVTPVNTGKGPEARHASPRNYAAVSEAGKKILDNGDLDDFIALLSDEQEQAIAEVEEEAISMDYYLHMVDEMADGAGADVNHGNRVVRCRIQQSANADNSYQVLDQEGRVLLTRGRIGLAVSLREGEIRLEGQKDFKVAEFDSQILSPEQVADPGRATLH